MTKLHSTSLFSVLCRVAPALAFAAVTLAAPATAQKMGTGGTVIDGREPLATCEQPLGTIALVEEKKAATPDAALPPQLAAFMAMARAQQGMSTAQADPMPLLKLLTSQSGCFRVVDRGAGFAALQAERQIAQAQQLTPGNGVSGQTLQAADYMLVAQIVYQDENAGGGGGGLGGFGGAFGGALGIKTKRLESQTMLTLTDVRTGVQEAVASGSARKKDTSFIGGGLVGLGLGAIAGSYESTDIGKVTAASLLDAYGKLIAQVKAMQARTAATATPGSATSGGANSLPALSASARQAETRDAALRPR